MTAPKKPEIVKHDDWYGRFVEISSTNGAHASIARYAGDENR